MGLSAQLIAKKPPITVDRNGGSFPLLAGHPRAHSLVSGNDRAQDGALSERAVR